MTSVSLLQVIKQDHLDIYSHYDQYVNSAGNLAAQQHWSSTLSWELARHSIGEELIVHPLFKKYLADGEERAEKDKVEHQAVKDRLYDLEKLKLGSPQHASLLKEIIDNLKQHTTEEEDDELPLLERQITKEESAKAAISFLRTKYFVPSSYSSAPFALLADLLSAPTDKLKAAFGKLPDYDRRAAVEAKKN